MAKQSKGKPAPKAAAKPKFTPKQIKAMAATPIPKRGDLQIGQKRKSEARSAAIGRGILKQM